MPIHPPTRRPPSRTLDVMSLKQARYAFNVLLAAFKSNALPRSIDPISPGRHFITRRINATIYLEWTFYRFDSPTIEIDGPGIEKLIDKLRNFHRDVRVVKFMKNDNVDKKNCFKKSKKSLIK